MTTLEILQAYPLGTLKVETPDGIGPVIGLFLNRISKRFIAHVDCFNDGIGNGYSLVDIKPILLPFSALCTPLPDGTVPAHRVLDILEIPLRKGDTAYLNDHTLWVKMPGLVRGVWTLDRFLAPEIPLDVATYLRSAHFAVGLSPDQYIRKDA